MNRNRALTLVLIVGLLLSLVFMSGCYLIPEGGGGEGESTSSIVPLIVFLVLIFGLMYFTMIRPQRKKQKEHQELMSELRRGDKIITAGGIYGVIESTSEDSIVIKIESGTTMRIARSSIAGKREK